ncbi:MAG: cysteine desulfurase family protein [Planctomycetota bacterium]
MPYLDNNATTAPDAAVLEALDHAHRELWANPSSVHRPGQTARQQIELARQAVADLLGAKPREIVFTSGGTESNNLALRGFLETPAKNPDAPASTLITTQVEHSAIREPAEALQNLGIQTVYLPVDVAGRVDNTHLTEALHAHTSPGSTTLVSLQWANNETGVIQPIDALVHAFADAKKQLIADTPPGQPRPRLAFHTDATQAVGKLPVDLSTLPIDALTCAAHKLHGPKGVGALYKKSTFRPTPQQRGGPQERELRGGTENTPAILGFGVAARLAIDFLQDTPRLAELQGLRDQFEQQVCDALTDTVINSVEAPRLWNTTNLAFPGLEAEAILIGLSERGVCASAGAACSSGSLEPSPVLLAMGLPEPVAHGSVRFSLSRHTTADELNTARNHLITVVQKLRQTLPV